VRPQLVVRNYIKGTSPELKAMAAQKHEDVVFPLTQWDEKWYTPMYEDLTTYSSLIHHAAMSINAASTVTLEFLMLDKPVINLDFDPPGTDMPYCLGYSRHIDFDHFRPIADSGAVMVARSAADMKNMLHRGLTRPEADSEKRRSFIQRLFGPTLDGASGERVAERLIELSVRKR
jgi:CDP-glycerol glycerophosphotransferase (TagB/SpsB family)